MMETKKRVIKFALVGVVLTLIDYVVYTTLAMVIFHEDELLWLAKMISTAVAAIAAYILHSKITWKNHKPTKIGIINFFVWNAALAIAIAPFFTWLFGLFKWLYEVCFNISSALSLPFSYEFIESTGIFALTTIVTMTLNYLFYDKLVFGVKK